MKLSELAQKIAELFNISELRELCFKLSINYEDLSGENRKDKVIELVNYFKRHRRLDELVSLCVTLRPNESWDLDKSILYESLNGDNSRLNLIIILGIVVVVGSIIGLLVFSKFQEEIGNETPSSTPTPTNTPVPPTNTPVPPTDTPVPPTNTPVPPTDTPVLPVSNCILTITFPFAELREEPNYDALRILTIPEGNYSAIDNTISNWGGRDWRWFKIQVNDRQGWVADDGLQIESKSSGCP